MKKMLMTALILGSALAPAYAGSGPIKIVLPEEADLLEPCMATRSNIGRIIMENVSETLTELDVRGKKGVMPRLAEKWEQTQDGSWRFHLRQGVKFSNGTTFDAKDVKHSFDRVMSDKNACESRRYFGGMKISANVVDPYTIDFKADPAQPILPLLMSLVTIVPEETPLAFIREPIGTGPYALKNWTPGQQIVLAARSDYWGAKPQVTEATYLFRADPSVRAAMVKAGEADLSPSISQLDATDPKTDFSYLDSETVYLRLDHNIQPLNDVRVRKALNLAIDRQAFIGTLVPQGAVLATALVPPTTQGWNPDVKVFPYDPEGAKKLLAEAKAAGVKVDTPITLIARTANFPNVTEIMEAVQSQLQEVGFKVDLKFVEVAEHESYYSKPFKEGRGPIIVAAMHDNSKGDPSFTMFFKYASQGTQSGFSDPKVDDLIKRASAAVGDERVKLWSQLIAYLHDDVVADALLFHMVGFSRVSPRIDFKPTIATNSMLQLSEIGIK
ncbi:Dipeptide transporter; periplasmic-binding component of ABC superfamily (plasmid) [Neorhizobium galegae bv. officinalis bv. officinalis str. HAMBI 1141]|uniref:Dipeptide transporter periplasmic-binding component of ABC superfamily n=1 Tax=Neorhizobium galegae bv. officinalis bv. officinalis str. HAMBI 1141 TaxID=1028801 RepID=A0A068TIQ9_NEOGA|nr:MULTISPECIES: ABC transporter substrate-binding protein [Neorhizobium]MCJ9668743.1 ABC transporter substrate-binding protein [Neorhizobium sp. SHOUNA12B]MCJ9743033.1 ABC transporter substrate-binding protein [Neorhizobium sp. SHOUNA12A]MCJ9749374.1 ABC transporter substrate-binding protein [Neorhizobium sp. BETTINA12A]CDN58332.1 Dipeptide transporter; periplasmic-binding component of ABC superfamily [Neorhizobium galegae bv. officinalis bv. officinalis str. HAMBI 1141]